MLNLAICITCAFVLVKVYSLEIVLMLLDLLKRLEDEIAALERERENQDAD